MSEVSYAPLIDDMVWSYSRITSFEMCPYKWLMNYILYPRYDKPDMFFSSYGTFCHELLADYYDDKIGERQAYVKYLTEFRSSVGGYAPSTKIYLSYFNSGKEYFEKIQRLPYKVVAVESNVMFFVGEYRFTGFIDLLCEDENGDLLIIDHKSHALKPRSNRKNPTKGDEELDKYLRQLYLYAIAVRDKYGKYPKKLCFNCYRENVFIEEDFNEDTLEEVKQWAVEQVQAIREEVLFEPSIDYWQCRHLCEWHDECECYR